MGKPVIWRTAFQANTGDAEVGGQLAPMTVGLSNGNILVIWEEDSAGTVGGAGDADVIGKIYDARGGLVRDSFRVNSGRFSDDERDFDIGATNDGGFILAYVDNDDETPTASAVIWERFNASGDMIFFREIASENVGADFLANPQVAVNNNNNSSYVTFTDDVGANSDVRGARLDAEGNIVTPEFDAAQNSNDADLDGDSAILRNGNLVTVYEEVDGGTTTVEAHIAGPDGAEVRLLQASNFDGTDVDPKVASLRNGGFVVVWNRTDDPADGAISDVQYQVFDASGTPVSGILNAASTAANENEPDVAALPDGDFVIVWDDDTGDVTTARRYNPDGSPEGGKFTVADGNATGQDVGVAADGRLLFAWLLIGGEISASVWDPRDGTVEAGAYDKLPRNFVETNAVTAFAEGGVLKGTKAADMLFGFAGADTIRGFRGNDFLFGGADDDTLLGGPGNDRLFGGGGGDVLNGQDGRDLVDYSDAGDRVVVNLASGRTSGRARNDELVSIEDVRGSAFDDRLVGDGGRNSLFGFGGKDRLEGRGNSDSMFGGGGNDRLTGGRGDDVLTGGGNTDRFIFNNGDGDDTIRDFQAGIDKIVIGTGASNLGDLDISQLGTDTLVEFANVTIVLEDVSVAQLSAADFIV